MIELKDYQKSAVRQLKERIVDMLSWDGMRQKLVLKAPTGSGKTVMTSALLDELKRDLEMKFMDCAYIWMNLKLSSVRRHRCTQTAGRVQL